MYYSQTKQTLGVMEKEGHVMISRQLVAVFAHGSPTLGNILVQIGRDVSWDGPEALDSIVDCNLKDKINGTFTHSQNFSVPSTIDSLTGVFGS